MSALLAIMTSPVAGSVAVGEHCPSGLRGDRVRFQRLADAAVCGLVEELRLVRQVSGQSDARRSALIIRSPCQLVRTRHHRTSSTIRYDNDRRDTPGNDSHTPLASQVGYFSVRLTWSLQVPEEQRDLIGPFSLAS